MSMSKAIGEWLLDTIEAAEYTALKMEQARAAPRQVMHEMHAYALGLVDETNAVMDKLREDGRAARKPKAEGSVRADDHSPRPVIRGGKSTVEKPAPRAKKVVSPMKFPLPPAKVQAYADTNGKPPKASK